MRPTEKDQERARRGVGKNQVTLSEEPSEEMFQEGRRVGNSLGVWWLGVTCFISANHLAR